MASTTWRVNGVDLESRGWIVERASMWRPPVSVRRSPVTIPGRHGVITPTGPVIFEEPTISLVVYVPAPGSSMGELELAGQELTGLLAAPGLSLTRISGDQEATAAADLVSVTASDLVPGVRARFTAALAVPGVFLRTDPVVSLPLAPNRPGQPVNTLFGSTAPVVDAVIRTAGPLSSVRVTDTATGTGLFWAGALASGRFVYLDAGSLTAWTSTSAQAWDGGTDVSGGLDYPAAGPLQLWPTMQVGDPADRQVLVDVTVTGGTADSVTAIRAGRSYL